MPKPIQVTDKNLNVQKASEGEVSFGKGGILIDGELYVTPLDLMRFEYFTTADSRKPIRYDRFPVDDEHSQNKI